ncbi:unnamed protein product [Closterium sp. Yama58-4]|nr:unnamed protein product [Closterium sp. Yama58-4]
MRCPLARCVREFEHRAMGCEMLRNYMGLENSSIVSWQVGLSDALGQDGVREFEHRAMAAHPARAALMFLIPVRDAETNIMAAASSELCTLERLCSSNFAKHLIAPLQRASSLLGSGELWQMHADAEEAEAAALAAQGDAAASALWPWKMSNVVARLETSLSRFTRNKPPPSPTAPRKPLRSLKAASITADLPAPSPKSPSPVSRRFKQRGAAESQIQFRLSPSHLAFVATASAELDLAASRGSRDATKATCEEPVGRVAPAARRSRASLSMDEGQLSAWQEHAPATTSDNVDGDSIDRNNVDGNDIVASKKESEVLDLENSFRMTCQSVARWIDGTGRAMTSAARVNIALDHDIVLSRFLTVKSSPSSPTGRGCAIGAQRALSCRRYSTICRARAGSGSAEARDGAASGADARAEREGFAADGIIVLAGGLKRDGTVPEWVARRLDAAAELYRAMSGGEGEGEDPALNGGGGPGAAMNGWQGGASVFPSAPSSACRCPIVVLGAGTPHVQPVLSQHGHMWHESSACAQYLMDKHNIPPSHIYKEWASYDTVANGFFSLVWHAVPRRWQRLLVVSQVASPGDPLEQGYEIRFISASDAGIDPAMIQARQRKEADSIRLLLPYVASVHSLPAFYPYMHMEHPSQHSPPLNPPPSQARQRKEADSIRLLLPYIASVRSLPAFHHYLHTQHRAYNVQHQEEFGRVKSAEEATFDPIKLCY